MKKAKNKKIAIGETLFIPMEGRTYIVYGINKGRVKLINYQCKTKISMLIDVYNEIKELAREGVSEFITQSDSMEMTFAEALELGSVNY
jgi:hypothetical protein